MKDLNYDVQLARSFPLCKKAFVENEKNIRPYPFLQIHSCFMTCFDLAKKTKCSLRLPYSYFAKKDTIEMYQKT